MMASQSRQPLAPRVNENIVESRKVANLNRKEEEASDVENTVNGLGSETKRLKPTLTNDNVPFPYPHDVSLPTRSLVQALYEEALTQEDLDQKLLHEAGLLSFEQVLLPAAYVQENGALKELQAKVQRDHPDHVQVVKDCRKKLMRAVVAAIGAAKISREERVLKEKTLEAEQQKEEELERERREQENAKREQQAKKERELSLLSRKRELKKKHPRNQELWREVAYLMTELSKLQKEEKVWKEVQYGLNDQMKELEISQAEQRAKVEETVQVEESSSSHASFEEFDRVQTVLEEINLSSARISQALDIISGTIEEADRVRKELYHSYRKDHQFQGYQGVKNPKALLKALIQSQESD